MSGDENSPSPYRGEGWGGGTLIRTSQADRTPSLTLPPNGGGNTHRLRPNADLSRTSWFRVGGCAGLLFKPENTQDLSEFLKALPLSTPVTILGVGSNVIVRDGGIAGVVIRLGRGFTDITVAENRLTAGAGALDIHVAATARDHGLAGLEFLSGIPGTIGGGVAMNAGAYGSDISQVLVEAEIVLRDGEIRRLRADELGFSYRNSALPEGAIATSATFSCLPDSMETIARRMRDIAASREATQPIRTRTGGSTFKNPPGHKAWELIDRAGCRGLTMGQAQVSELHCNFLINTGQATAAELEALGEEVRRRVREVTGVELEWEIKRIGISNH